MSFYHNPPNISRRFDLVLSTFLQKDGLHFAEALPEAQIQEAFDAEGVDFAQEDDDIYTPAVTLWASLSQVLHKQEQRSCLAAVSRVLVLLLALGRKPCAKNTGAYCRARARLSEVVLRRLTTDVAKGCPRSLAIARPPHVAGRRQHGDDGRHSAQSGRLSAERGAEARPGIPHRAFGHAFVLGHGDGP